MPTEATFFLAALLIIAAASGFVFKVYSDRDRDLPPRISADYIRGLNLVLSRKTDEALELFVQMAKVDDETLETHFALGHLFQAARRGRARDSRAREPARAPEPQRNAAAPGHVLACRGLPRRGAVRPRRGAFDELAESTTLAEAALEKLVNIYEREKEWQKAIDAQRKLEMLRGATSNQVAHYYCELAEQARAAGDRELAREHHLKATIRSESGAAARHVDSRRARARGAATSREAIALYEQIIGRTGISSPRCCRRCIECYRAHRQAAVVRREDREVDRARRDAAPRLRLRRDHRQLSTRLRRARGLRREVRARQRRAREARQRGRARDAARRTSAAARSSESPKACAQIAMSSARYRCSNCGYSTQRFIWHCPSCKLWETVRPIQSLPLETVLT